MSISQRKSMENIYNSQQENATKLKANKRKFIWGLVCLLGPTGVIVLGVIVFAIVNFIAGSMRPEGELFGETPIWQTITNVVLFFTGAVSVIAWLPGIIGGIILLASRNK
jgi:hypothetical protein